MLSFLTRIIYEVFIFVVVTSENFRNGKLERNWGQFDKTPCILSKNIYHFFKYFAALFHILPVINRSSSAFTKSKKTFETVSQSRPQTAGVSYSLQTKGKKEKVDSSFAGFERHTKGIGEKYLLAFHQI